MTDRPIHQRLFRMIVGAGVGLGICSIGAATGFLEWLATLPGEDVASVALAMIMFFLAGFAVLVSSSQRAYRAIAENYREGDPVDAGTLRTMRVSAVIMILSGVLLLSPTLAVQFGAGESASIAVAAAMGVLLLIVAWLNLRVVRSSDELTRATNSESSVIGFWVTQAGLYGWAAMAKMGLVGEVSLWTLMMIATGVYLVIAIGVAIRRGLFA